MSDEKRPDSVSIPADRWIADLLQQLELEFLQIAKFTFSRTSDVDDYQRTLLHSVRKLLAKDGMAEDAMQAVFADPQFGWTDAKNARRFELIEKEEDDELTFEEAQELESLTFQMRFANRPLEDDRVDQARMELEQLKNEVQQTKNSPH
jgi:hypothetical protein